MGRGRALFFFNDTATTEIYTLSLHDALPISARRMRGAGAPSGASTAPAWCRRSEEHTSELQSQSNLVCRLLLEKKKKDRHPSQHPRSRWSSEFAVTHAAYCRRCGVECRVVTT